MKILKQIGLFFSIVLIFSLLGQSQAIGHIKVGNLSYYGGGLECVEKIRVRFEHLKHGVFNVSQTSYFVDIRDSINPMDILDHNLIGVKIEIFGNNFIPLADTSMDDNHQARVRVICLGDGIYRLDFKAIPLS